LIRTSDSLTNLNDLRERDSIAPDPTVYGPSAFVIYRSSNDGSQVCGRGQSHDGTFMPVDDDRPLVLEVEDGLQWVHMFGCLVREGKVVEKEAWLE
jgi:hypothetical protein